MFRCDICNERVRGNPQDYKGDQACNACVNSITNYLKESKKEDAKQKENVAQSVKSQKEAPKKKEVKRKNVCTLHDDRIDKMLQRKKQVTDEPKSYELILPTLKLPKERVYICSPYSGAGIMTNIRNAKKYARFAFTKGFHPFAPHLYYPQFLDDIDAYERAVGMHYALMQMWSMKEVWVFGKKISEGMRAEIDLAEDLGIKVRYFDSEMQER